MFGIRTFSPKARAPPPKGSTTPSPKKTRARPDEDNMLTEPQMPFGKYRGKPISEVFRQDHSYLAWFFCNVDGNEDIKRAIRALPGFRSPNSRRTTQPVGSSFDDSFCIDPRLSREDLDRLCWEILHPPKES
jgi:hypothetical protein